MKKTAVIAGLVLLFAVGMYLGYKIFAPAEPKTEVSTDLILTSLKNEGFLVTQTYVFNETVEIDSSTGSVWKDVFWSQYIEASANIKVSSGVNLSHLTASDVVVDGDSIEVILPEVETYSIELLNGIQLENKQGILKKLFDNDDGYNDAFEALKQQAALAVEEDVLRNEARSNAIDEVTNLIHLIDKEKNVTVSF